MNGLSKNILRIAAIAVLLFSPEAEATYRNRAALMGGLIKLNSPVKSAGVVGLEVEHRWYRWVGFGASGNYVLSKNPQVAYAAAPEFFFHPFEGDWFFNAGPLFQMRSGGYSKIGVRTGSRAMLFSINLLRIGAFFDYDFINGGHQTSYGATVEIHTF